MGPQMIPMWTILKFDLSPAIGKNHGCVCGRENGGGLGVAMGPPLARGLSIKNGQTHRPPCYFYGRK